MISKEVEKWECQGSGIMDCQGMENRVTKAVQTQNTELLGAIKYGISGDTETWDFCGMERQQCQGNKKIQGNGDTELPGDGNTRLPGNEDIWYFQGNGNTGLLSQQDCRTVKAMEMLDC